MVTHKINIYELYWIHCDETDSEANGVFRDDIKKLSYVKAFFVTESSEQAVSESCRLIEKLLCDQTPAGALRLALLHTGDISSCRVEKTLEAIIDADPKLSNDPSLLPIYFTKGNPSYTASPPILSSTDLRPDELAALLKDHPSLEQLQELQNRWVAAAIDTTDTTHHFLQAVDILVQSRLLLLAAKIPQNEQTRCEWVDSFRDHYRLLQTELNTPGQPYYYTGRSSGPPTAFDELIHLLKSDSHKATDPLTDVSFLRNAHQAYVERYCSPAAQGDFQE